MENINTIFLKNSYLSTKKNCHFKEKTAMPLSRKDIFKKENPKSEISIYLDILYKESDEEILGKMEKLKISNSYLPIQTKNLSYGNLII